MSNVKISQLNGGTNRTPVKANNPQIEYEEGGVSYPCKITDALDFYKAASASLGSVASFNLTGLDTVNFDYDLSVRLKRSAGGVAADYLTIQFGDTGGTPTWFTGGLFLTPLGANSAGLTTSGGITRVAQVQNNATLSMGTDLSLRFAENGVVINVHGHSYMWENIIQLDGTTSGQVGALKLATPNQSWTAEYSLYAKRK
jgi:hypothetical protein